MFLDGIKKEASVATVTVTVSHEVVGLLSDQLYRSPLKAIEELVVNSFDAEASTCKLFVPTPIIISEEYQKPILIFDDGVGLADTEISDLWYVGSSAKRRADVEKKRKRKQIGKFGIGKLAVNVVARKLTYVSKKSGKIIFSTMDFDSFKPKGTEQVPVVIPVYPVSDAHLAEVLATQKVEELLGVTSDDLAKPNWTLAIIEELREKASEIKIGRLKWILSTAMPLRGNFKVYLNAEEVIGAKDEETPVVKFSIGELSKNRINTLKVEAHGDWTPTANGEGIVSSMFPLGVLGQIEVFERPLPGKSDDLVRSNGFFVKVRGRLIAQEEPFFGMAPLHHGTLTRLRAEVNADDLDVILKAPREEVESSKQKDAFEALLVELVNEAREKYESYLSESLKEQKQKKEHERRFVSMDLLERPVASALLSIESDKGADADNKWFYLEFGPEADLKKLAQNLLDETQQRKFSFKTVSLGKSERFVKFHPETNEFYLNANHEFVINHQDDTAIMHLLNDIAVAETLLEVHLRLNGIAPSLIGELLEERDKLLRSLVQERTMSPRWVMQYLRDSSSDKDDLEVALVMAMRALGFTAKHVAGAGQPDGIAKLMEYPSQEVILTLEAKSSKDVPDLAQLDFAGLQSHMGEPHNANGCILVAPDFPGLSRGNGSEVAKRAIEARVSCWTIDQLATAVENISIRHITAKSICDIIQNVFAPDDVKSALDSLLASSPVDQKKLSTEIISALARLDSRLPDSERSLDMIAGLISGTTTLGLKNKSDLVPVLAKLASASQGGMLFDGQLIKLSVSFDELRRRLDIFLDGEAPAIRESYISSSDEKRSEK